MEHLVWEFILRTSLIAAAAGLAMPVLRIRMAAAQHALWTGVLAAMLALPLWMAWGPKAALRVLPARGVVEALDSAPTHGAAPARRLAAAREPATTAPPTSPWGGSVVWIGIYLTGAGVLLLRLAVGAVCASRLTGASCVAPVTIGWLHPRIVLPDGWRAWPPAQLDAVLIHERAHARRRDPLVQGMALLNRALFWFHPLSWWLECRLAALAEEACDAAVLAQGHHPREYAAWLLDLARAVERAGRRLNETALAMPGSYLPQRIRKMIAGGMAPRVSPARMACAAAVCALCSVVFAAARLEQAAQDRPAPVAAPRFEVASIKVCKDAGTSGGRGGSGGPPGRLSIDCVTVTDLVTMASINYANGERNFASTTQLSGGPAWIHSERYQIDAKAEGEPARDLMRGPMLQALLEDRFQLKIHREAKEIPVYFLTVAKGGLKLRPVKPTDCPAFDLTAAEAAARGGQHSPTPCGSFWFAIDKEHPGRLIAQAHGITLGQFCRSLGRTVDRPVIDQSGVSGLFDVHLEFASDETTPRFQAGGDLARWGANPDGASEPAGPRFPAALQKQLGLKLEPGKGPGEFVVIDRVERPTEN